MENLFKALVKAQSEIKPAKLDCKNPHYNSRYASLSSVKDAYGLALSKHGLCIIQKIIWDAESHWIETILAHESGEMITSKFKLIIDKQNMQGLGSAITYGRRYGISALLGIVDTEDDDANEASQSPQEPKKGPWLVTEPQIKRLFAIANACKWSQEQIKLYMNATWKIDSTKLLDSDKYDQLIATIQAGSYVQAIKGE